MDTSVCKEGFLQKAGKRSFQAWRKRWFVLNGDNLKYYTPSGDYNDTNLLGTIQMFEVQSISPSKSTKHGFDIISRGRTYNVSAKSDLDRDDWILSLRKASSSKRRVDSKTSFDGNQLYTEIGTDLTQTGEELGVYETILSSGDKSKKQKKDKKKQSKKNGSIVSRQTSQFYEDSYSFVKPRANTTLVEESEKEIKLKHRASSDADILKATGSVRTYSMLRKMSRKDDTEELYTELNEELENCSSEEDEDDDIPFSTAEFILPKPRDELCAFDQIAEILGENLSKLQDTFDLNAICFKYDYKIPVDDEFPVIDILKMHLEKVK